MDSFDERKLDQIRNCSIIREDRVLGNTHLNVAIRYARGNFDRGNMISKTLWNEILLYLSLQRQVHKAFELVGVKKYEGKVIRVEFSDRKFSEPEIEETASKREFWNVGSVEELLERMALFHLENY